MIAMGVVVMSLVISAVVITIPVKETHHQHALSCKLTGGIELYTLSMHAYMYHEWSSSRSSLK